VRAQWRLARRRARAGHRPLAAAPGGRQPAPCTRAPGNGRGAHHDRTTRWPALNWQGAEVRAVCWHDKLDVRVESVPEPKILNPRDAIVQVSATAICGSDLHLYGGFVPGMVKGDILGHEFMGEVVEVGAAAGSFKRG